MKKQILCVHLLNDYSGSPLVFSEAIKGLVNKNYKITVFTNQTEGFLSNIEGVEYRPIFYKWHRFKIITLFYYLWSQVSLFFKILRNGKKVEAIYINTLLPFGAALAAKLLNKKTVYHLHETSIKPQILKYFLLKTVEKTADRVIYVSNFLKNKEPLQNVKCSTIYNALPAAFSEVSEDYLIQKKINQPERFYGKGINPDPITTTCNLKVLMLCSLKAYKGVFEMVEIAKQCPSMTFMLVLNAAQSDIDTFFHNTKLPKNLQLFPTQKNVHPFYQNTQVVLNLSRPTEWVETFGMTALEAMSYGLPTIVPPVGGIAEVVQHNKNGFLISVSDLENIIIQLKELCKNSILYQEVSKNAIIRAQDFSIERMQYKVCQVFSNNDNVQKMENNTINEKKQTA